MNLKSYTEALTQAESLASVLGEAYVVKHWEHGNDYSAISLRLHTKLFNGEPHGSKVVASVDHTGIITESKWVRDMVAGVVA